MKLTTREWALILLCTVLLVVFSYIRFFYYPNNQAILSLSRDIAMLRASAAENPAARLAELKGERERHLDKREHFYSSMAPDLSSSAVIGLLSTVGEGMAVRNSLLFLPIVEAPTHRILPVRLSLTTTYGGFKEVLAALENLPACLTISNLQVTIQPSVPGPDTEELLDFHGFLLYNVDAAMTINFFMEPLSFEENEEEKLETT